MATAAPRRYEVAGHTKNEETPSHVDSQRWGRSHGTILTVRFGSTVQFRFEFVDYLYRDCGSE